MVLIRILARELGGKLSILNQNLDHDFIGYLATLGNAVSLFLETPALLISNRDCLKFLLNHTAPFLTSLVKGVRSIALCHYEMRQINLSDTFVMAARHADLSAKYAITSNHEIVPAFFSGQPNQTINIKVDPDVTLHGDSDAFVLLMYNLIKNPIKLARHAATPFFPSLDIECTLSSDRTKIVTIQHFLV